MNHVSKQNALHKQARSAGAGLAFYRLAGNGAERLLGEAEVDALHLEKTLVLLDQCILRFEQNALERRFVEVLERRSHRQTTDEFRDQAVFQKVLRLDFAEDLAGLAVLGGHHLGAESDRGRAATGRDDLFKPGERAAANEQNIGGVDLQELLLRMLAPPLWWHRGYSAFHDLEQRLLHAFARYVAGDRRIVGLAADLVDFVDIDDATLGALHIVVGRLQELQDDVLDVLAHIAGLGQSCRIRHREGYIENSCEGLRQQRFARTCRSDQQDVRLRQFDVVMLGLVIEPLIVIVNRNRQHLFGMVLADNVVVEDLADFLRGRDAVARFHQRGLVLLADDVHAKFDTFVADEDGRSGNELAHLVLALTAKRAVKRVLRIAAADFTHSLAPVDSAQRTRGPAIKPPKHGLR